MCRDLVLGRAGSPADDGAGVAHAFARRRRLARDERRDWLLHVLLDKRRRLLFGVAANLPHHQNRFRLRIVLEQLERVDERGADDGIAAQADAGRLPQFQTRQLPDRLVGERAATADEPDAARLVNVSRHDAHLALSRRDDARTVGPNEPGRLALEETHGSGHVEHGDALGDGDDERNARVGRFHDRVGRGRRRHENHAGTGPGLAHRLGHRVEERKALLDGAPLARRNGPDHLRAVFPALLGVKGAGFAQTLTEDAGVFIDENTHGVFSFTL